MNNQALVLLSGGLDSVYNLYAAHEKWPGGVSALFFGYGQRAYKQEFRAAQYFSRGLKVPLQDADISNIFDGDRSSLTSSRDVPMDEVNIESLEASQVSAQAVWVANRNGVFLNVAACFAEKQGIPTIVPGFNREEAQTFPDNSEEYIDKMNACLKLSTATGVQIHCFSQKMEKSEIIREAKSLGADLSRIWSCYHSGGTQCGRCESCQRYQRAYQSLKS